ncbi:MAG: hypothetical protein CMF48_00805 [Legionellales bacterium]|nr:hypothetical protein [Legionellales bacterium]
MKILKLLLAGAVIIGILYIAKLQQELAAPIKTLEPGTLTIGVLTPGRPQHWNEHYLTKFAKEHNLVLKIVKTEDFSDCWLLPANQEVDIAAHNITPTIQREGPNHVWSKPYTQVRRSLLIRREDANTIHDFEDLAGKKIAFLGGTIERENLSRRKEESTQLVPTDSFQKAREMLENHEVDAVAEGHFDFEPMITEKYATIAVHDFVEGSPENIVFSINSNNPSLINAINDFIDKNDYNQMTREQFFSDNTSN